MPEQAETQTERESKHDALKRLSQEGGTARVERFRARQKYHKQVSSLKRDDAFYKALEEFPPMRTS